MKDLIFSNKRSSCFCLVKHSSTWHNIDREPKHWGKYYCTPSLILTSLDWTKKQKNMLLFVCSEIGPKACTVFYQLGIVHDSFAIFYCLSSYFLPRLVCRHLFLSQFSLKKVHTIETAGYVRHCHLFVAAKNPQE